MIHAADKTPQQFSEADTVRLDAIIPGFEFARTGRVC